MRKKVIIEVNENLPIKFNILWHGRVRRKRFTLHSLFAGIPLEPLKLVM